MTTVSVGHQWNVPIFSLVILESQYNCQRLSSFPCNIGSLMNGLLSGLTMYYFEPKFHVYLYHGKSAQGGMLSKWSHPGPCTLHTIWWSCSEVCESATLAILTSRITFTWAVYALHRQSSWIGACLLTLYLCEAVLAAYATGSLLTSIVFDAACNATNIPKASVIFAWVVLAITF